MDNHPAIIWSMAVFMWTATLLVLILGLAVLRDWRKR